MLTLVIGNKNLSSWSLRPWLAMKQAGLDFTEIVILLDKPTTRQEILKYSPSLKVPVLLDDNLTVWESLAICEYVAENFAPKLWPEDPKAKALARSVSSEMHAGFQNLRQNMPMNFRSRFPSREISADVQTDIDRIKNIWRECLTKYKGGGDFLFGNFSIADAMFAPVVSRFFTYGVTLDPDLKSYAETVWSLTAMQEWLEAAKKEDS